MNFLPVTVSRIGPTYQLFPVAFGALLESNQRVSAYSQCPYGIFEEAQGTRLEKSKRIVGQVVAEAGGTDPVRLLGRLKAWQKDVYEWSEPGFYGQSLAQIAYFSDFAIWIPWVEQS